MSSDHSYRFLEFGVHFKKIVDCRDALLLCGITFLARVEASLLEEHLFCVRQVYLLHDVPGHSEDLLSGRSGRKCLQSVVHIIDIAIRAHYFLDILLDRRRDPGKLGNFYVKKVSKLILHRFYSLAIYTALSKILL